MFDIARAILCPPARRALRRGGPLLCVLLIAMLVVPALGQAQRGSGLLVTFVARTCPSYTDITANRARNDIQESLRDLGADTPYKSGQMMDPEVEQANQPDCSPLPDWTFTIGTGYLTRAVSGPWGSLSIVTGPFAPAIQTAASTPLLDDLGQPTGRSIAGAATVELSPQQAAIAARPNSLWAQGGTPPDPILDQPYPGQYGFGALRCAIDDLNGDNVEWIGFPSGVRHVFCFAYYVKPPPTSGTIIIRKQVQAPAGMSESFPFQGNVSFNSGGNFALSAGSGQPAQQSFYRAETFPGEAPWNAREIVPPNWRLTGLTCASRTADSTTSTDLAQAAVSITLAAGDTVTCTYTDEFVPPDGGLLIRKITHGATGRFGFQVHPAGGGNGTSAVAETKQEGLAVDAQPGPLSLSPGSYTLSESVPGSHAGRWTLTGVECDGHDLAVSEPIHVSILSGQSTVCTLANTFVALGSITIAKVTQGGLASTGFVITPGFAPPFELHQSATTTREGSPATALGDSAGGLELGRYLIQETIPQPSATGHWELTDVQCDGEIVPFEDGQASITLTQARPHAACTFTNVHRTTPPEPPGPPGGQVDPSEELAITKHAQSAQVALGQPASYVVRVKNDGHARAREVVVDDQPSKAVTVLSVRASQGSCGHSLPITCTLGGIAAGHDATVSVVLMARSEGTLTNHAVAATSGVDPSIARDAASARVSVGRSSRQSHARLPAFTG